MADILDAAQTNTQASSTPPADPAMTVPDPLPDTPPTEPEPMMPAPMPSDSLVVPPAPEELKPDASVPVEASPDMSVPQEPAPPAPPPEVASGKPKKKFKPAILIAGILLLLLLPLTVLFVQQQQEIRSRAAKEPPKCKNGQINCGAAGGACMSYKSCVAAGVPKAPVTTTKPATTTAPAGGNSSGTTTAPASCAGYKCNCDGRTVCNKNVSITCEQFRAGGGCGTAPAAVVTGAGGSSQLTPTPTLATLNKQCGGLLFGGCGDGTVCGSSGYCVAKTCTTATAATCGATGTCGTNGVCVAKPTSPTTTNKLPACQTCNYVASTGNSVCGTSFRGGGGPGICDSAKNQCNNPGGYCNIANAPVGSCTWTGQKCGLDNILTECRNNQVFQVGSCVGAAVTAGTTPTILNCGNIYVSACGPDDFLCVDNNTVCGKNKTDGCKGATGVTAACPNYDASMGRGCESGYYPCVGGCCKIGKSVGDKGGGGGGGGNGTTATGGPQCVNIQVYKDGNLVTSSDLPNLHEGDTVTLVYGPGADATKAQFSVNGGDWNETTTKNGSGAFTWDYTLSGTSFSIEAQYFDGTSWH